MMSGQKTRGETRELDAIVVGAGFAGLYALYRLRTMGLRAQILEAGSDIGGTWFWNRYPGARCDVESLEYSYSFSEELQQEWVWPERFAAQPDILRYINHVADRLDLRQFILTEARVVSAAFDRATDLWTVTTAERRGLPSSVLHHGDGQPLAASGAAFPGIGELQGQLVPQRTLAGRRRRFLGAAGRRDRHGLIGDSNDPDYRRAGQTSHRVSADGEFQCAGREPPDNARGGSRSQGEVPLLARGSQAYAIRNRRAPAPTRSALEDAPEERERVYEEKWGTGGNISFLYAYNDLLVNRDSNETASEFVRNKIRSIVRDPKVAELLLPNDHPIGTKRLCLDDRYFETFNRENVTLVDVRSDPIAEITPSGLRTRTREFELDDIAFATGFDAITGALLNIDISVEGGPRLD